MQSWSDFFQGSPSSNNNGLTSRLSVTSGTVYVFNSFFKNVEYLQGAGGAISFVSSDDSSILLVEETTFLSCVSSDKGGGIYFYDRGSAVINKICSINCSSTGSNGIFYYNCVSKTKYYKNDVNLTTISSINSTRGYPIYIYYGTIQISKTNESFISCSTTSAYRIQPSGSDGEITGMVTFSTFYNTTATSYRCLNFGSCSSRIQNKLVSCNVIKNSQTDTSEGVITFYESTEVEGTCILQNYGPIILYNSGRTVSLSNCVTDFGSQTYGAFNIKNVPATTFINSLTHFASAECEAIYGVTNTKRKQIVCFTAGEAHQKGIKLFLSLPSNLFSVFFLLSGE
jgi:hypothetical protein